MDIKKTALYRTHQQFGAKLVEFAGYYMPIQYKGINEEHLRVRQSVGIFDVSHMGEFFFRGPRAEEFLQFLTINDVNSLRVYQAQYSAMCYENGGIVDDLLLYRFPDKFLMVVNAANLEKDFQWIQEHLFDGVEFENRSQELSLLAIQGRYALDTLQKVTEVDISKVDNYWLTEGKVASVAAMISRTGYTGEDGFEVMLENSQAEMVWNAIMAAGREFDIEPIGLGARDTLRMEVKYCLYGNDIDHTTNPLEAGLGWITKLNKQQDFIAKQALLQIKQNGLSRKLVGFQLDGKAIPRHGYKIVDGQRQIGVVTSGMFSPLLKTSIGLGYVPTSHAKIGTDIHINIRDRIFPAQIVKTPFYQRDY